MTPCKSDQTSDYLHVESSIRQGTPYSLLGDGILSGYKPNYQKVKRKIGTPLGHGIVPVSKMGHGGTSGNFGNKFNERNDLLTKMGPYNSSLQSEVEALGNVSCENGLSSALPSQQHGLELEQTQYSCQGIVTYLKDLLHKSEAVQSTLHGKVKDSYEVIQNQTEQLLKNEADIKSLRNELQTHKDMCEQYQRNERSLRMKNKQLVTVNEKNLFEQDLLQKRITELQKDIQSIWSVHRALQSETSEKQIIVEKALSHDLKAFEDDRRTLMKENELISKKAAEFEKCAQEANMNLVTLEKENSRLSDEKQQVAEAKEAVVGAHEQLKVELIVSQRLCEKLIAEKAHLIQRTMKSGIKRRDTVNQEPDKDVADYNNNNNENITIDELFEALYALPFIKDASDVERNIDVASKIKEHVEILEKRIIADKEEFEKSWKLLKDHNDQLANQNNVLQCEKAKAETERGENAHARKELLEKLEELKKERTEFMERQNKLIMSMKEIESEKTNLKRKLEEKDCEIGWRKTDVQEKLAERDRTITSLQEKLKSLDSAVLCLKEKAQEAPSVIQKRSLGIQTLRVFEAKKLQRRHSEGSFQKNSIFVKHSDPQHPDEVIKIKKLNLVLQKKLEDSENERLTSQQELEEVIQHFKDAFDEQIAKELDEERRNNDERERELLSELKKKHKECVDRKEHSIFVSKAYQKLQSELENLWSEKEDMNRKCESLEYERNQLREQVEELCQNHSDDAESVVGSSTIGKKKSPSTSKQPSLPRRTKVS